MRKRVRRRHRRHLAGDHSRDHPAEAALAARFAARARRARANDLSSPQKAPQRRLLPARARGRASGRRVTVEARQGLRVVLGRSVGAAIPRKEDASVDVEGHRRSCVRVRAAGRGGHRPTISLGRKRVLLALTFDFAEGATGRRGPYRRARRSRSRRDGRPSRPRLAGRPGRSGPASRRSAVHREEASFGAGGASSCYDARFATGSSANVILRGRSDERHALRSYDSRPARSRRSTSRPRCYARRVLFHRGDAACRDGSSRDGGAS